MIQLQLIKNETNFFLERIREMQNTNTIDMLSDLNTSILYKVDGSVMKIDPPCQGWDCLKLSELLGDVVEYIQLNKERLMVVKEEAILKGATINERATELLYNTKHQGRYVSGDAVVVPVRLFGLIK